MSHRRSMNVSAFRTETGYTAKNELFSILEVIVPADEVKFLRDMHRLQDSQNVRYDLSITERDSGETRALRFHSKGSKMKDFVPVAVLVKASEPDDALNALFDSDTYELTLNVELVDDAPLYDLKNAMQNIANQEGMASISMTSDGKTVTFENQGGKN